MISIGTRDSKLALWQATNVQAALLSHGIESVLVPVKSEGDIDLVTPLYEMGVQGVFTRTLDAALLNNRIDIAVHSMKDVPTQLPDGIVQAAVLPRGHVEDVLVYKADAQLFANKNSEMLIATSSIRRKAQWLYRYPNTRFENLRGNMQSRLDKLHQSNWDGAIFAKAGLDRIELLPANHIVLDWMLPAPAQGAVMVVCRQDDAAAQAACDLINDEMTAACVRIERDFLRGLMGGCATPISAFAEHHYSHISFTGNICLPDGSDLLEVSCTFGVDEVNDGGYTAAEKILQNGGRKMVEKLKP
ncbi:MAG TPA: hydroxymethylbilane synthase [Phnomibacter sp.]|nr:hydroxymethylbilane synthase [Phnomibacter sp.]